jgi:ribonuclease P protein component
LKNSFPKKLRLISREDFARNKKSSLFKSKYFLFFYSNNTKDNPRLGLKISKKAGNAVRRNYLKRISREIFRNIEFKSNFDIIVVVDSKNYNLDLNKLELYNDLKSGFFSLSKS